MYVIHINPLYLLCHHASSSMHFGWFPSQKRNNQLYFSLCFQLYTKKQTTNLDVDPFFRVQGKLIEYKSLDCILNWAGPLLSE